MLISIINTPPNGCSYHRQLAPNALLAEHIEVIQTNSIRAIDEQSSWDKWKVAQFNATDPHNQAPVLKYKGLKIWLDLDDTWYLETTHPFYDMWRRANRVKVTEEFIRTSDVITCASERLCELAVKFNPNTHHVPNFISPLEPQFQIPHRPHDANSPVVFGWIGAKQHVQDLQTIASPLDKIYCNREIGNKYRVIYGGYVGGPEGPDPTSEKMAYYLRGNNSKNSELHYGMMPATDHTRYAFMYQNIDVALAPLKDTKYNSYKSELKIIEAGHFGIPVIASDIHPYNKVIEHGVNGFLCKKEKDWYKYMMYFIDNPTHIKLMGDKLKETIEKKFNPETITNQRIKILESL